MEGPEIERGQPNTVPPGLLTPQGEQIHDVFISYSQADRAWAEWVAWVLEQSGHSVIIQAWDCLVGMDFTDYMMWARDHAKQTLALLSNDYLNSPYCMEELKAAYVADPSNSRRLLVQLRVADCKPKLMQARVYGDLFDKDEAGAKNVVLRTFGATHGKALTPAALDDTRIRLKPDAPPVFPGEITPKFHVDRKPAESEQEQDLRIEILSSRLINAFVILVTIGTIFVGMAYFVGSQDFQDKPEHTYWDRMFNFQGDPQKHSDFGLGPGLFIEVLRQTILLFVALIAMPIYTFKESARKLMFDTPARKLLGIPPGEGAMNLDAKAVFFLLVAFVSVATPVLFRFHFSTGPVMLWLTEGYRDGKDHNLEPASLALWAYWKRCMIPYSLYLVYSSINYVAGVAVVLTLGIHAGIRDLVWMSRWSADFRQDCEEGTVKVDVLHRRFESDFLPRMRGVLERYYALLVFILTGFAFKVWLDRINLSPKAYEIELYALWVATVPVLTAYFLSTIFYRSAIESAAREAVVPALYRSQHGMLDYYTESIKRSVYLPIAILLLASIIINVIAMLVIKALGW